MRSQDIRQTKDGCGTGEIEKGLQVTKTCCQWCQNQLEKANWKYNKLSGLDDYGRKKYVRGGVPIQFPTL